MPSLLYFPDLVKLGLVRNWPTLNRWVRELNFPAGRMCGKRRVWLESEVIAWVKQQPTTNRMTVRGCCKTLKLEAEARRAADAA
jgi:predicted DNA-binding transcriptional regulator AlpA